MGTHGGGLARFDGREFKVYTTRNGLLSNSVLGLHLDRHNNLWLLHARGLTKYNGKAFKTFQDPDATNAKSKAMWRLFELNDTIFALSGRAGITKIYNDSLYYTDKSLPYEVKRMHVGPNGEACFYLQDETFLIRRKDEIIRVKADTAIQGFANFFNYKNDIFIRSKNGTYQLDLNEKKLSETPWQIDKYVLRYDEKDDVFWTINTDGLFRGRLKDNVLKVI